MVSCKFCAEEEGGSHPCCPFLCAARASTLLLHFALSETSKYTFLRISAFSWLRKSILSYLFSVVWFYTNRSFPEFSVSFPFQGPGSFSESLLRLLGSFPASFYCTACARLSLPPYFPACSLWSHPAEEWLGTHSPLWVMKSQTSI